MATKQGSLSQQSQGISVVVNAVCLALTAYHLLTGMRPFLPPVQHANVHLGLSFVIVFWGALSTTQKGSPGRLILWLLGLAGVLSAVYIHISYFPLADRIGEPTPLDLVVGMLLLIAVFEGSRREFGNALVFVGLGAILYCFAGPLFPGMFNHSGFRWNYIVPSLTTSVAQGGIYSTFLFTSASFVAMFLIFGAFLQAFGAADFFVKAALAVAGRYRGGPALASIISSCAVGSINGSAIANVMTTGVFTIPLMKSRGYRPSYAAAVEAVASTGGMFMPPVMGVAAFVMASLTGIPYINIALAAAIPALLYYYTLGLSAVLRAKRRDLPLLDDSDLPPLKQVLKEGWYFTLPLIIITLLLIAGYSPIRAAFFAVISLAVIHVASRSVKNPRYIVSREFWTAVYEGCTVAGKSISGVAVSLALMGVVTQAIVMTNLPTKMVFFVRGTANSQLFGVILVALCGILFGMGVPSVATYVLVAVLVAPILIDFGLSPMATHLFAVYYGVIGNITPPVGAAVMVASRVAGAPFWESALTAVRLGLPAFILPFYFIFHPALLLEGTVKEVVVATITSFLGLSCLAMMFERFMLRPLSLLEAGIIGLAGVLLIAPEFWSSVAGCVLLLVVYLRIRLNLSAGS